MEPVLSALLAGPGDQAVDEVELLARQDDLGAAPPGAPRLGVESHVLYLEHNAQRRNSALPGADESGNMQMSSAVNFAKASPGD
jgi:hypothetical protein